MSDKVIGVRGTINWKGQTVDFFHSIDEYADKDTFPMSPGPKSVVQGTDKEQSIKYESAYHQTDQYTSKLHQDKYDKNSQQRQMLHITYALCDTRNDTDRYLTSIMNGVLLSKRDRSTDDLNNDTDEETKRQRLLEAQEYHSDVSDDDETMN